MDKKKSKKIFKFFEKKFINKKCAYGPKMKPRPSFRLIFWSIWSGVPNNPRGGEKKGSFLFLFYFLGDMGIKWVFLIELPDTGTFGFLLPANKIVPTGQSIFEGIRALAVTISHTLVYWTPYIEYIQKRLDSVILHDIYQESSLMPKEFI